MDHSGIQIDLEDYPSSLTSYIMSTSKMLTGYNKIVRGVITKINIEEVRFISL